MWVNLLSDHFTTSANNSQVYFNKELLINILKSTTFGKFVQIIEGTISGVI